MDELIKRHDWWERHEGFDLWSIPHFLYGAIIGFLPSFGISFVLGFAWTLGSAVLWEIGEKVFKIKESKKNILLDIALSVVAYVLIAALLARYALEQGHLFIALAAVIGINAIMVYFGWRAHRRRERTKGQKHSP